MGDIALLCGAGISAGPPASLPLAQSLHEKLCRCFFDAAERVAPGTLTTDGLACVNASPFNVIARLAAVAGPLVAGDLLRRFSVAVPNEAHMLAAAHAVRGSYVLTLNFDDGIEVAYALLEGQARLPQGTPSEYHWALKAWRAVVRPTAPLRVVASRFSTADYGHRPLLAKLRGSRLQGWHRSLVPQRNALRFERHWFSNGQMLAVQAAAAAEQFAIAGFSGTDVDCREALLCLLRPGHFSWTAAEMDDEIVARIGSIDSHQPTLRRAVEGVRASLPHAGDLPRWPEIPTQAHAFESRFTEWQALLPVDAAAKVYAQLLAEAGFFDQASAIRFALRD